MPSGKGTYGNKVGRPKKSKKECKSCKGMKSKTHKGDKDYTTKKGDKDYHQGGLDVRKKNMPYTEFVAKHRKKGKSMKEIGAMWRKHKNKK